MKRSRTDEEYRQFALNGNMWKLVLSVSAPLCFYNALSSLYGLLDSLMASHISAASLTTVAYLSQINLVATSMGMGIATGGGLKISEAYGKGDYGRVSHLVATLMTILTAFAFIIVLLIPLGPSIMRISGTPEELISYGSRYYAIELVSTALTCVNGGYIAIERARGNTSRIFKLNTIMTLFKLALTAIFVYIVNGDITLIAVASVASQLLMLGFGLFFLMRGESAFRFRVSNIHFKKETISPMASISVPLIADKTGFNLGKLIINSMCNHYGSLTVGALGVANRVSGVFANMSSGFQDGGASIISQNYGAGRHDRVVDAFKKIFIMTTAIGVFAGLFLVFTAEPFARIFANSKEGMDEEFCRLSVQMIVWEGVYNTPIYCSSMGFLAILYGLGKTKLTMVINVARLFVFRITIFWALQQFTDLGSVSVGIMLLSSNVLTAILAGIIVWIVIKKYCKEHQLRFWHPERAAEGNIE